MQILKSSKSEAQSLRNMGRHDLIDSVTPEHYSGGIEPVKYILSHGMGFAEGCVVKYVTRYKHKGQAIEDLNKARHYLDILLQELEE
jgi:hypothetical protein